MNALPGREYDLIQFSLVNDNKMYSQIKFVRTPGHENVKYCTGKDAVKMSADINKSLMAVKDTINQYIKGKTAINAKDSFISKYLSEEIKSKNLILIGHIHDDKQYEKDIYETLNFIM